MNGTSTAMLMLKYQFMLPRGSFRKFYIVSEEEPILSTQGAAIDKVAQKMTKGKYGWGAAHLHPHKCAICGLKFWSEKKDDKPLCQKWACYKAYYSGNGNIKAEA